MIGRLEGSKAALRFIDELPRSDGVQAAAAAACALKDDPRGATELRAQRDALLAKETDESDRLRERLATIEVAITGGCHAVAETELRGFESKVDHSARDSYRLRVGVAWAHMGRYDEALRFLESRYPDFHGQGLLNVIRIAVERGSYTEALRLSSYVASSTFALAEVMTKLARHRMETNAKLSAADEAVVAELMDETTGRHRLLLALRTVFPDAYVRTDGDEIADKEVRKGLAPVLHLERTKAVFFYRARRHDQPTDLWDPSTIEADRKRAKALRDHCRTKGLTLFEVDTRWDGAAGTLAATMGSSEVARLAGMLER